MKIKLSKIFLGCKISCNFTGLDGRMICKRCKRSFNKQRVFNAHKCLAVSDYIDLSNTTELVKASSGALGMLYFINP